MVWVVLDCVFFPPTIHSSAPVLVQCIGCPSPPLAVLMVIVVPLLVLLGGLQRSLSSWAPFEILSSEESLCIMQLLLALAFGPYISYSSVDTDPPLDCYWFAWSMMSAIVVDIARRIMVKRYCGHFIYRV